MGEVTDDELSNEAVGKRVAADHDAYQHAEIEGPHFMSRNLLPNLIGMFLWTLDNGMPIQPGGGLHELLKKIHSQLEQQP